MAASPQALIHDINSRFDVRFSLPQKRTVERIPTGIPAVDALAEGGIPRGALTFLSKPSKPPSGPQQHS